MKGNNVLAVANSIISSKDVKNFLIKNGKYGCIAFGIYCVYDLCKIALNKGYSISIGLDREGRVDFNITSPIVTE